MRLFTGIALPDNIRKQIDEDAGRLKKIIPGRYVPKETYHITLAFIGETDRSGADAAKRAMNAAVAGQEPVELSIGCPGYFGRPGNAILHMKVDGQRKLQGLDRRLRSALRDEGLSFDEKPFNAHITLARKAEIDAGELKKIPVRQCKFKVSEITLFHSTRVNGVLTYLPVYRAGFKKIYSLRNDGQAFSP